MNLSEALYRHITGGRSPRTEPTTLAGALKTVVGRAGSVAAAARALDVPRRTLRAWLEGRQPRGQRTAGVIAAAVRIERRARLSAGREARVRDGSKLRIAGETVGDARRRSIDIGRYLRDGTMGRVVDAYLAGKPLPELHRALHAGITDKFYRALFAPRMTETAPPTGGGGAPDDDEDNPFAGWDDEYGTDDFFDDSLAYEGGAVDIEDSLGAFATSGVS